MDSMIDIGSNAIEVHIHNLRRKLGPLSSPTSRTRLSRRQWPARAVRPWSLAPALGDRHRSRGLHGVSEFWDSSFIARWRAATCAVLTRRLAAAGGARLALLRIMSTRKARASCHARSPRPPGPMPFDVVYQITTGAKSTALPLAGRAASAARTRQHAELLKRVLEGAPGACTR